MSFLFLSYARQFSLWLCSLLPNYWLQLNSYADIGKNMLWNAAEMPNLKKVLRKPVAASKP